MLNSSFSLTIFSQNSVNIALEHIVDRQLNDDGIFHEEVFHELAPDPALTCQTSHPLTEADIYDFVPSNLSMPGTTDVHPGITILSSLNVFTEI